MGSEEGVWGEGGLPFDISLDIKDAKSMLAEVLWESSSRCSTQQRAEIGAYRTLWTTLHEIRLSVWGVCSSLGGLKLLASSTAVTVWIWT